MVFSNFNSFFLSIYVDIDVLKIIVFLFVIVRHNKDFCTILHSNVNLLIKGNEKIFKKYLSHVPKNLKLASIILLEKTEVKTGNPKDGLQTIEIISAAKTIPIPTPDLAKDMVDSLVPRDLVFCNEIIYKLKKKIIHRNNFCIFNFFR
jgi:hypothetical protein